MKNNNQIAIIGLGYVGLPLAVEFAKKYMVVGFDINLQRTAELNNGEDNTLEVPSLNLKKVLLDQDGNLSYNKSGLVISSNAEDISSANTYIITVPTPVDIHKKPNLKPLISATEIVGAVLKKGDVVIYESTVYPGCTEDDCVPVLEKISGLKFMIQKKLIISKLIL